jgi:hypothetical protein
MIIVDKGKHMFRPHRSIPFVPFEFFWSDATAVWHRCNSSTQWCDSGETVTWQWGANWSNPKTFKVSPIFTAAPVAGTTTTPAVGTTPASLSVAASGLLRTPAPVPVKTWNLGCKNGGHDATVSLMNQGSKAGWGTANSTVAGKVEMLINSHQWRQSHCGMSSWCGQKTAMGNASHFWGFRIGTQVMMGW